MKIKLNICLLFFLSLIDIYMAEVYHAFRYSYIGKYINFQIVVYDGRCTFCLQRINDNTFIWDECNRNSENQRFSIVEKQKLDHYQIKSYYGDVYLNYNGLIDFYITPASNEGELKIFVLESNKCLNFNSSLYTQFNMMYLFDECDKNYYSKIEQKFKFVRGGFNVNHFTAKGKLVDNFGNLILGKYLKNFRFYKPGVDLPATPGGYYQAVLNEGSPNFEFFTHKGTHSYTFENNLLQTNGYCKYLAEEITNVNIHRCTQEYTFTIILNDESIKQVYTNTDLDKFDINRSPFMYFLKNFEMRDNNGVTIYTININTTGIFYTSNIPVLKIKPTVKYEFWYSGKSLPYSTIIFQCKVPTPLTSPIPTYDDYLYCSEENKTCYCHGTIAYGAKDKYKYAQSNSSYECSNDAFGGDPIRGHDKTCKCLSKPK
jgi:hypothetical protein